MNDSPIQIESVTDRFLEDGKSSMRGRINTVGIEESARIVAEAYTAPGNTFDYQRLQGIILAAFEAGMLHQLNRTNYNTEIVDSLRRQSEFYAANPRVDATPEWDDV